jgi:hypothetical protein
VQTGGLRYLTLAAVLLAGAALYATLGVAHGAGNARWPGAEVDLHAAGWSAGQFSIDQDSTQTAIVSRVFKSSESGVAARMTVVTSGSPKLYAAGAEVPFLGTGYQVETPGQELVPTRSPVKALVARRGTEQWLVLYAYGERRGLLGNGPLAWSLAISDGLLGRENDFYKLYLLVPADQVDPHLGLEAANLADSIFPQVANWYASAPA